VVFIVNRRYLNFYGSKALPVHYQIVVIFVILNLFSVDFIL